MILSFALFGATARRTLNAWIERNPFGQPVITLQDGSPVSLSEWRRLRCRIVKADKNERKALMRMGLM